MLPRFLLVFIIQLRLYFNDGFIAHVFILCSTGIDNPDIDFFQLQLLDSFPCDRLHEIMILYLIDSL